MPSLLFGHGAVEATLNEGTAFKPPRFLRNKPTLCLPLPVVSTSKACSSSATVVGLTRPPAMEDLSTMVRANTSLARRTSLLATHVMVLSRRSTIL